MKMEETVVVTVSMIGMAETGTGTATFSLDTQAPFMDGVQDMGKAMTGALAAAMEDVQREVVLYIRDKYGRVEP